MSNAERPVELNGIVLNRNCSGVLIMMRDDVPGEKILNITTGGFDLEVSNLMLTGLNTLDESLEILKPMSPYKLNTTLAVGNIGASAHFVLKLDHGSELGLDLPATRDEFDISISTDTIKLVLGVLLEINTYELWSLSANEINVEDCWLNILNRGDLYELALKFGLDPLQELDLILT